MSILEGLSPEHAHELQWDSHIQPPAITARGYRTLTGTGADRDELEALGFKPYVWNRDDAYPGLLIPMHGADGTVRGHQFKPATPRAKRLKSDGTPVIVKYETPTGHPLVVDVPSFTREAWADPARPLWITEGMKKTDALTSQGMAALGLTGVWNWRREHATLGDWEDIPLKGRPVVICFDSDAAGNRHVQLAMGRLGAWLRTKGTTTVHYLVVPAHVGETPVKGVDDFLAAGGTLEELKAAATTTPPGAGEKDASFTDAFLVEELAESLRGRFCWASGLGWLKWNGRIWKDVSDVEPLEAVRVWASEQFDKTLAEQGKDRSANLAPKIAGWRAILGKSRLTALRDLSRGMDQVQRDAAEFDGDPDLLTVTNGTLHLPSGKLLPFDPDHCITKSADAEYRPEYGHPSWTAILKAVPADMHPWYQDRLGQALTGYPVPDHTLVIAHGTGANGKSSVVNVVRRVVGTYGVMISDRVLMASPDAHPTELMDLRGARYALMEETPEARHLNVQRLKTTLGTERITARRIRQDPVEFLTSHSLFINTNYRPVVTETDWGTWRRLSLMPFPFTYRKPLEPLEGPWERRGDPALAYAANDPQVRSAALTWMVEGAKAWYERGRMMLEHPERVERETRQWRSETDLILGFSDECLRFEREAFTQTREMLSAFNDWAGERGHRPWNDRTFATRFGDHDAVRVAKVQQGRFSVGGKQLRGWSGVEIRKDNRDPMSGDWQEAPPEDPWTGPEELPERECYECDKVGCAGCVPEERTAMSPVGHNGINTVTDGRAEWREPLALGFDLETASVDQLFTGGHEGPYVRLMGVIDENGGKLLKGGRIPGVPLPDFSGLPIEGLNTADVIYGHNILGFDLLALAHHHGADYDALAAKAIDTRVLAYLVEPPMAKAVNVGYDLDSVAKRLGHEGKTDDLKGLAKRYGGYDKIPVDSREYQNYLRGDLAATKAVYEGLPYEGVVYKGSYAEREMKVVTLQNRMTLNGWAMDTELLAERVDEEEVARFGAIQVLNERYGVPLAAPDRFKLKRKADWPLEWRGEQVGTAREAVAMDPEHCVTIGLAERVPGKVHTKPWVTDAGKAALIGAFVSAGARHVPRSPKSDTLLTSADALGEGTWYCTERRRAVKGMLHPDAYGSNDAVRALVDVLCTATGVRDKYNQVTKLLTPQGRVHGFIGAPQGSGRWAMSPFTTMGKRTAAALAERDVVVADDGHVLMASDHKQLDIRTVAALSQDAELIALLQPDSDDFHNAMAEVYFGDRERRDDAKPINHGVNYGQGAHAIAERNGLDEAMVKAALDARGDRFHGLMTWTGHVREQAEAGLLLDNGFGRMMRATPERAFTQAPALMGQGASRDVMCESLLRLDRISERRVRPFLRGVIHDEIVLSVPEGEVAEWQEMLREAMTWEWRGVPILCDVSEPSYRWSGCK